MWTTLFFLGTTSTFVDADPVRRAAYLEREKQHYQKRKDDPKYKTLIAGGKNIMLESVLEAIEKAYNIKIDIE